MKICPKCSQPVGHEVTVCPSCGCALGREREKIDDYRIVEIIHEGRNAFCAKAYPADDDRPVMIRVFTSALMTEETAYRLKLELEELKKLPADFFVQHRQLTRSSDGLWYRVSEWIEVESWGDLIASGELENYRVAFDLFYQIANALEILHQHGHIIPHLTATDVLIYRDRLNKPKAKIDYKLSRFLDPALEQPSSSLKRLLDCHPDVINCRPLDVRSDVWSLGKLFVEILSGDFETCRLIPEIDRLPLPHEAQVLFKVMLADDPDLRPSSMAETARSLAKIRGREKRGDMGRRLELLRVSGAAFRMLQQRVTAMTVILTLALLGVLGLWYYLDAQRRAPVNTLETYANKYSPSIAFVAVEYWIKAQGEVVYRKMAEGTAFLVDKQGLLLTNRHVACPWLEDELLPRVVAAMRARGRKPEFGYRSYLWFEGEEAFVRSGEITGRNTVEDLYNIESAFRSDGRPHLSIAGVAKPPVQTRSLIASPLRDDFAVLKIDQVPQGLAPLPLAVDLDPLGIPKLYQVAVLGFPLGRRYQEKTVNVSVTRGHVRRSFSHLIQIDGSLYGGNSGGPVIDRAGRVIGIASGVAVTQTPGPLPMVTQLWNMGMVLPVNQAAGFLTDLRQGKEKWNGVLDLAVEEKVQAILAKARQGRWAEAVEVAAKAAQGRDPTLVKTTAMIQFCAANFQTAKGLFQRSLLIDPDDNPALLMLYLIDWLTGAGPESKYGARLQELDWRSSQEFHGWLARVLAGREAAGRALLTAENNQEQAWLNYIVGLIERRNGRLDRARELLSRAALLTDDQSWEHYLIRAAWDWIQRDQLGRTANPEEQRELEAQGAAFRKMADKAGRENQQRRVALRSLLAPLAEAGTTVDRKLEIIDAVMTQIGSNRDMLAASVYYRIILSDWARAMTRIRMILNQPGRPSSNRLAMSMLEPLVLKRLGRTEQAEETLADLADHGPDAWYTRLAACLLGRTDREQLLGMAESSPFYLLTAHTALGLWDEAAGEPDRAMKHYRQALESFLDNWSEYELAVERLKQLKPAN